MEDLKRSEERFEGFCKALAQLQTALQQKEFSILEKDGVIRRFEFTVELAWKTMQDILNERGHPNVKGPKPVIKQAFRDDVIKEGQSWIDMLDDRNKSSHLYDESQSIKIFDNIQTIYHGLLSDFKNDIIKQIS